LLSYALLVRVLVYLSDQIFSLTNKQVKEKFFYSCPFFFNFIDCQLFQFYSIIGTQLICRAPFASNNHVLECVDNSIIKVKLASYGIKAKGTCPIIKAVETDDPAKKGCAETLETTLALRNLYIFFRSC
jgi:hypothetical protein